MQAHVLMLILFMLVAVSYSFPLKSQRLSLADWGSYNFRNHKGFGTYAFGYDIEDPVTNNIQFRQEERHANGTVTGSYGYVQPDGHVYILNYVADERGYRVQEENPNLNQIYQETTATPTKPQFEGEFYPEFPVEDDSLDNLQPIQFPSKLLQPPPVYEYVRRNPNLGQKRTKNTLQSSKIPNTYSLSKRSENENLLILYKNPEGGSLGWVNFKV